MKVRPAHYALRMDNMKSKSFSEGTWMLVNTKAKWSSFNVILVIVAGTIAVANVFGQMRTFELDVPPLQIEQCYGSGMALVVLRPFMKIYLPDCFIFLLIIVTCFVIVLFNKDLKEYICSYTIFADSTVNNQISPSNQESPVNSNDQMNSHGQLNSNDQVYSISQVI